MKKNKKQHKELKLEKNQYLSSKIKINKRSYTVSERCSEKIAILKTDKNPYKIRVRKFL